jgi:hypothetical protein
MKGKAERNRKFIYNQTLEIVMREDSENEETSFVDSL